MNSTPTCDTEAPRYLLLATDDGMHGRHSSYTHLADYIKHSNALKALRVEPRRTVERAVVRAVNSLAVSRWYRLASLKLELNAWQSVQAGFRGVVHFMWGERDWGFFDKLPMPSRPPLCATFHACPDTLPEIVQKVGRLRNLNAIILMSEVQRAFFESNGVRGERIHVIHHGVDCQYFRPQLSARSDRFTVLFVGNYRRNFVLLQRVCSLLEAYEDICVQIVVPKTRIRLFQSHRNATIISDLTEGELRELYRKASCLLMTLEAATANNAILEAMACGLPVVSENIGGVSEYTGTKCAMLCVPGSAEALVKSILMLYEDQDMVARMSLLARERAEELDWCRVAERTVRLYENLLAG
jgi:glycosyltransferase involved in cell wall biosynthesis